MTLCDDSDKKPFFLPARERPHETLIQLLVLYKSFTFLHQKEKDK